VRAIACVVLLAACAADGSDLQRLEQEQAVSLDCRPVRVVGCFSFWNDRECFHVPPACARPDPEPAEK
jgi:hypothetical protein